MLTYNDSAKMLMFSKYTMFVIFARWHLLISAKQRAQLSLKVTPA